MNLTSTKLRSLALLAAVATAALGTGCSTAKPQQPKGEAKIGVNINALTAVTIDHMTLTIGVDATSGAPSFPNIVTSLTNNDLTKKLSWSAYVQGIPAGTQRVFTIQAFDVSNTLLYSGSTHADITAGATASVSIVIQGTNDGGFQNSLPVVDSLASSANLVVVGTTPAPAPVSLSFVAHDPDSGATLSYAWASDCSGGSFDAPTGAYVAGTTQTVHWTAPSTVPTSGVCTETLKVTDDKQGSITAYLAIQIQANNNGNAIVDAYPNSWPMISGIVANEVFTKNAAGKVVQIDYDFVASATDPDGDDIQYKWTVAGAACQGAGSGFTASGVTTPTLTLVQGGVGSAPASSTVHFVTQDLSAPCIFHVDVTDYWKNGVVPTGSGLAVARGGDTVGIINGSAFADFTLAPEITFVSAPGVPVSSTAISATFKVQPGQLVNLQVNFVDPTPSYNPTELPFSVVWQQYGGALAHAPSGLPGENTGSSPGTSSNIWTAAAPTYQAGSFVTVTVTNKSGQPTSYTWNFVPANPCTGSTATPTTACDPGIGKCADPAYDGTTDLGGHCDANAGTASSQCVANSPVTCAAAAQCQQAGVCQPSTGSCAYANASDGTSCSDGNSCTVGDVCVAGACTAGTPYSCAAPSQCQTAVTCDGSGATPVCKYTNKTDGTTCSDGNSCTVGDTCQAGACVAGTPYACAAPSDCQASVTCVGTGATPVCNYTNKADGTGCGTAGCTNGQTCLAGACQGGTSACPANDSCAVSGGNPVCSPSVVAPQVARDLQISGPVGLAMDTAGNTYVAGAIYSTTAISFDGHSVASGGDADIFLAKYNSSGVAQWAVGYGDGAAANPQIATGAAVTNDGTLAVIFNFSGAFSIGSGSLNSSSVIDGVGFLKAADGTGVTAKQFNNGTNGALKAIAANPNDTSTTHGNRIAVCGLANGGTPALPTSGAVAASGNDIIIGAFKSDGTQLWGSQFSSAGTFNDECDSVAVDDNGDVWAIGSTTGASLNFGGATSALTGPGNANRKYVWIAKFNGATGAALLSAIFSGTGQVTPNSTGGNSIVIDPTGNVIAGGQVVGAVTFGSTTLTSAGAADAWVAKFNGTTLAPIWAERLGGTKADNVNGLAVDYYGDVIATGAFNLTANVSGTTASTATITATGTTAPDVFVWKLNGNTGGTDSLVGYGDAATQTGDAIAANRFSSGNQVTFAGTLNSSITFPAPAGAVTATGATDVFLTTAKLQ